MTIDITISGSNAPQNWLRRSAAWITDHELWLLLLIVPLVFMLPYVLPSYGLVLVLALVAITWFARWLTHGWLAPPNPLNAPILAILLLTFFGYWIVVDHYFFNQLWVSDAILRAAVFFAMVNGLRTQQAIVKAAVVLLLLFTALALLLFFITSWDNPRQVNVFSIYDYLPRFIGDLSALATGDVPDEAHQSGLVFVGIQPRMSGDLLGSLLPLAMALVLFARRRHVRIAAALLLLTGSAVLILSQDLPGILGFIVAAIFVVFWWRPRLTFIGVLAFTVVIVGLIYYNRIALISRALDIGDFAGIAVVLRLDMWNRALAMIGDMPFSGIGLSTFNLIQSYFYTGHIIGPEYLVHQWLLQSALDTGLPGLLAFLWLVIALFLTARRAYHKIDNHNMQVILVGVMASFIAFVVGGIAGAATAPTIWIMWSPYALAAAIFVFVERQSGEQQNSYFWRVISSWRLLLPFGALIIMALLLFPTARIRNWGLIQAHQAIYAAIETGDLPVEQAEQATLLLTRSLDREPDRAQLYGTRASLYAWQGDQEAALADLERRVALDLRDPYGTYAPFVAWKAQVNGEPLPDNVKSLEHVYHQWSTRFPKRAEFHVLLAMAMERADGNPARAIKRIELGLEEGAQPRALLQSYLQRLQMEEGFTIVDYE